MYVSVHCPNMRLKKTKRTKEESRNLEFKLEAYWRITQKNEDIIKMVGHAKLEETTMDTQLRWFQRYESITIEV